MTPDRDYSDYVRDMLEMAQALEGFVADMEYDQFAHQMLADVTSQD